MPIGSHSVSESPAKILGAFLIGLLFVLLFLLAPPARAGHDWPTLHADGFSMEVRKSALATIPLDPEAASNRSLRWASLQAERDDDGDGLWRYLRNTQAQTDWFLIHFDPLDESGDFVWTAQDQLVFTLGDSSRVVAEIVTATQCNDVDAPCVLKSTPVAVAWDELATAGGYRAYAGVPRERIRAHGVLGVSMEVSP